MIPRYQHPNLTQIWSDYERYHGWWQVELDYLMAREQHRLLDLDTYKKILAFPRPTPNLVEEAERQHGHDVVGFLVAWTKGMPSELARHIHLGLTSSDLVDNHHFDCLKRTGRVIVGELIELYDALRGVDVYYTRAPRIGRTHGQHAEPTTLGNRFNIWACGVSELLYRWPSIQESLSVVKVPGATGAGWFIPAEVRLEFAKIRDCDPIASTQIIPRQRQLAFASWLLEAITICEEVAMEIRLSSRTEVAELREGGVRGRIGSSAMPHKMNPIGAEQLSGLARVARADFAVIAETTGSLHHERDISNSSVERTAVVDFLQLAAFIVHQTGRLLTGLEIDAVQMTETMLASWNRHPPTSIWMYVLQADFGVAYADALHIIREATSTSVNARERLEVRVPGFDWLRFNELVDEWRSRILSRMDMRDPRPGPPLNLTGDH